jgi:hypothetical protein
MSSSFSKIREEVQKKRNKDHQKLRTDIAARVLAGIVSNGVVKHSFAVDNAVKLTDALLAALGYGKKVEPSPLTEEEKSQTDD